MALTYLDITNTVLRRLNEIELTSLTFGAASGIFAVAKDSVNQAIRDINQLEYKWPFNHQSGTQVCVADQFTYPLPSDYKIIDWDTFRMQRDDALGVDATILPALDYREYHDRLRSVDMQRDAGEGGVPTNVYPTQDDKLGVTPIPDAAYTIEFEYWSTPADLALYNDTTNIPDRFKHVIVERALMYCYELQGDATMYDRKENNFRKGLSAMRSQLTNKYRYAFDTRAEGSTPFNSSGNR